MTLEELDREIAKKEEELEELKRRKLFLTPEKKSRIFSTVTVKNMLAKSGYRLTKYGGNDCCVEDLQKEAILRATDGRTNDLDEVTEDEYLRLHDLYLQVAKEKLDELESEKAKEEKRRLEEERKYKEEYKELIAIDEKIKTLYREMEDLILEYNAVNDGRGKELDSILDYYKNRKETIMKERKIHQEWGYRFGVYSRYYEPD